MPVHFLLVRIILVSDAYGKIPEGLTQGNDRALGMFDQCINIIENLKTTTIRGKYCYAGLVIPLDEIVNILICIFFTILYTIFVLLI